MRAAVEGHGGSPQSAVPALAWLRKNLFARPLDALLTLSVASGFVWLVLAAVKWAILDATWTGASRTDCASDGACWAFIANRAGQFAYGFYPQAERWRVNLTFLIFAGGLVALLVPRIPGKVWSAAFLLLLFPPFALALLHGGFGLAVVSTEKWGGLFLTLGLGVSGIVASFPIAFVLALARQSDLRVFRIASAVFIETCRGLPLIAVLFMARILLPFALPVGTEIDALALAAIGIILFESAYLAEVFRGGLVAIPTGQYAAAQAIGFGYWRTTAYVVAPQVIQMVVPGIVNNAIALLKNTTLVMVLGLFEFLNIVAAGSADAQWLGLAAEGYALVGVVFWTLCFGMSRYSQWLERRMAGDRGR